MPLYTILFAEQGGYRCQCRIRAAAIATPAEKITRAAQRIWGPEAVWVPFTDTTGCVWRAVGADEDAMIPQTGLTTVEVQPGTRRRGAP